MSIRSGFLWVLKNTLNRVTMRVARSGHGPFTLVRHVGRTSGKVYETPIMVARTPDGFVAELTYGPEVNWYRNIVAAGRCDLLYRGAIHHIDRIEPCSTDEGLAAYGNPRAIVLRILRRHEFRLLHEADAPG
jgi:deazaflavin-dependent oxidoreductase (nitroreductase family)